MQTIPEIIAQIEAGETVAIDCSDSIEARNAKNNILSRIYKQRVATREQLGYDTILPSIHSWTETNLDTGFVTIFIRHKRKEDDTRLKFNARVVIE